MRANEIRIEWQRKVIYPSLKGERLWACNSSAVVAMESNFWVLELGRPDWAAFNYYEPIDWFGREQQGKTSDGCS